MKILQGLAALLAVASLAPLTASADVVKCVDAQGKTSYTDRACPPGTTQQGTTQQSSTVTSRPRAVETSPSSSRSERERDFDSIPTDHEAERRIREMLDTRRADLQARCDKGDRKSCAEVVCLGIYGDARASDYRACAKAKGYESGDTWVQMSEVSNDRVAGNGSTSVTVSCLTPPDFMAYRLRADPDASRWHEAYRFYLNMMGGPDFATWQEAAHAACAAQK